MNDQTHDDGLWLTEEEALGLLDIILISPADLTAEQRSAIMKLSEFCRKMMRHESDENRAQPVECVR